MKLDSSDILERLYSVKSIQPTFPQRTSVQECIESIERLLESESHPFNRAKKKIEKTKRNL